MVNDPDNWAVRRDKGLRQFPEQQIVATFRDRIICYGMNTFRIVPVGDRFQVIETAPDGRVITTRDFQTEAAAEVWIVKRATVANMADLARWLRGNPTKIP